MDISRLIPFIKEALVSVSPEEVAAQLQKQEKPTQEDKERETVDNDVIEQDEHPNDDQQNEEGEMMDGAFKELDVEEAIQQAKEQKLLNSGSKVASYWTLLQRRIK